MKTEYRKHALLLIPALLLVSILIALMPASRAFAGSIRISTKKATLYSRGGKKKLHLHVYDGGEQVDAAWKSSRKSVATVSSNGIVRAKGNGTAKITARYHGKKMTCTVKVYTRSKAYKNCIKAYNRFLMNPYVIYTGSGDTGQADNFYSIDLDENGIPELLVNVVASSGNRYHVLYHYKNGRISTGQRLGVCSDFVWYGSKRVMNYRKIESDQTLSVYSRDNGTTLNCKALIRRRNSGKVYYYKSDGSMDDYGEKMSAEEFFNYVNHDLLNFCSSRAVTFHVNTPYNRSVFLK